MRQQRSGRKTPWAGWWGAKFVLCFCSVCWWRTKGDIHMECSGLTVDCPLLLLWRDDQSADRQQWGEVCSVRWFVMWEGWTCSSSSHWACQCWGVPGWWGIGRWEGEGAVVWPATGTTSAGTTAQTSPPLREISGTDRILPLRDKVSYFWFYFCLQLQPRLSHLQKVLRPSKWLWLWTSKENNKSSPTSTNYNDTTRGVNIYFLILFQGICIFSNNVIWCAGYLLSLL